jgi:hypothetical protein
MVLDLSKIELYRYVWSASCLVKLMAVSEFEQACQTG